MLKTADSKKQLVLPLSIFGLHLFLGNWWNGEKVVPQHPGQHGSSPNAGLSNTLYTSDVTAGSELGELVRQWPPCGPAATRGSSRTLPIKIQSAHFNRRLKGVSTPHCPDCRTVVVLAVVFFGRRKMEESIKWMGAFWASIAGELHNTYMRLVRTVVTLQPGQFQTKWLPLVVLHVNHNASGS